MLFNNIDLDNYFKILSIRRPLLPNIYTEDVNIKGRDGSLPLKDSKLNDYIIEVDIELKSKSREEFRQDVRHLAGTLFTRDAKKLIFKNESDKYYLAKLTNQTDLNEFYHYGTTTLIFKANDPISFGATRTISITDNVTLYLQCTYETLPKFNFDISFNINKIRINNISTGEYVEVNHSFIIGDKVEIDFSDKWKVRKNGIVIAEDVTIESDFFSLEVGENELSINIPCTLEYTERWL